MADERSQKEKELELLQLEEEEHQHQTSAPQDVSQLESAGRGLIQGATFNFGDEAVGALGAGKEAVGDLASGNLPSFDSLKNAYIKYRDSDRARNKAAARANPWTYGGSNLLGGLVVPGIGVAGTLGAEATAGAKIAQSMGVGAMAGGLGGAGASEAKDVGGLAKDTVTGAGVGAAIGGAVRAVPEAIKGVASLAQKPLSALYDQVIKFQPARIVLEATRKGFEGKDLTDLNAQFERLSDVADEVGDVGLAAKKQLSGEYSAMLTKLKNSDEKVDLKPFLDKLKGIEDEFRSIKSPEVHADVDKVMDTVKNYSEGMPTEVDVPKAIPGKPSAQDALASKLALEKARVGEMGSEASTHIVPETDELGRDILIPKIVQQAEDGDVTRVMKPMVDTPAVPDTVKLQKLIQRVGGGEQLTPKELFDLQKLLGGHADWNSSNLATNEGKLFAGKADSALKETVNTAIPELAAQNSKYKALKDALGVFGLDSGSSFIKNSKTGELELAPPVFGKIQQFIHQAEGNGMPKNKAMEAIKLFTDNLEAAGIKVDSLKAKMAEVGEDISLARDIAGTSLTSMSGLPVINTKTAGFAGNVLGRATRSATSEGQKLIDPVLSAGIRTRTTDQNDEFIKKYLPAKDQVKDSAPEDAVHHLGKDVYSLSEEQLGHLGDLLNDKGHTNLGKALHDSIAEKNKGRRDAILFSLMQNPDARKILRGEE